MIDTPTDRYFDCPQCGGHMSASTDEAQCVAGHVYTAHAVLLAATRESAAHLWRAIRSLENCQRAARWAIADPSLRVRHWLVGSALVNGQTASLLKPYARALDKALHRLEATPVQEPAGEAAAALSLATCSDPLDTPGPCAS